MNPIERNDLDPPLQQALQQVESTLAQSHCPHSGLSVAAGLILQSGGLVLGVNYESVSYGLTLCAERSAIARAQAEGKAMEVKALVLAASHGEGSTGEQPLTPCGACRQWLLELSNRLGHDFPVYSFWRNASSGVTGTARELLPSAFDSFP